MIRKFLLLSVVALSVFLASCTKEESQTSQTETISGEHQDPEGYYSCPMHPQVHEHKPGACPICGMPLVKVSGKDAKKSTALANEIQITDTQKTLAAIGKYKVVRMDLEFSLAVSGRMQSPREVVFQIYESDLQLVKKGGEFSGSPSTSPNELLTGKIKSVDTLLDPSSRTVRVVGLLDEPVDNFIHESAFHGEIKAQKKNQLVVPEDAVLHAGEKNLVYLVSEDNTLKPKSVILGKKTKGSYQVISGLKEGDVISTGPNFLIDSEAKIRGSQ